MFRVLEKHEETIERLVIAQRRQQLAIDALAEDLLRVSERLSKAEGRAGGRLGGRPRKGPSNGLLPLDDIPRGDKDALRAHFRVHPPKESDE